MAAWTLRRRRNRLRPGPDLPRAGHLPPRLRDPFPIRACCPAMVDLGTGLALVLVVEGVLWSLFPEAMKQAAARAVTMESGALRLGGLVFACFGVLLVWLLRR